MLVAALACAACGSDEGDAVDSSATAESVAPATSVDVTATAPTTDPVPTPPSTEPATTAPVTTDSTSTEQSTTEPSTTTSAPPADVTPPDVTPAELASTGPYPVGVVTRTLPSGGAAEIWYPADDAASGGNESYRVRDFLPEALAELVPTDVDDSFTIDATRDAAPAADGPFPVVLFSHGATSFRLQSSALAHHLASWGMVVASTDHPSRDLRNVLGGTAEGQRASADDLRELRTFVAARDTDDILAGSVDAARIALGGHSAGGATVAEVAGDQGIVGYVSYASGLGDVRPDVPSLFLAGSLDAIVDPVARTQAAFDMAPPPSWLWVFADAGHLAFSDLCAVGGGDATLVDLAEAAGLGAAIDDRLRVLATDGCEEPNRPVEEVWPGVHQAATGFYRWAFGIDDEPVGLDSSAVTPDVTVSTKQSP
jgi:dienelactone hydrolase